MRERETDTERERQRERDRETERDRERQTDRQTDRDRETDTERETEREGERETDRQRDRQRQRERESVSLPRSGNSLRYTWGSSSSASVRSRIKEDLLSRATQEAGIEMDINMRQILEMFSLTYKGFLSRW